MCPVLELAMCAVLWHMHVNDRDLEPELLDIVLYFALALIFLFLIFTFLFNSV